MNKQSTKDDLTLITIPGNWKDYEDMVRNFIANSIRNMMFDQGSFVEKFLEEHPDIFNNKKLEIEAINSVLIFCVELRHLNDVMELCEAISVILSTGGEVITMRNCCRNIVWPRVIWKLFDFDKGCIFDLFISVSKSKGGVITCGMENFSLKDVFIPLAFDEDSESQAMAFAYYIFNENPNISSGHTFSVDKNSPVFLIQDTQRDIRERKTSDEDSASDDCIDYYNEKGLWKLERLCV